MPRCRESSCDGNNDNALPFAEIIIPFYEYPSTCTPPATSNLIGFRQGKANLVKVSREQIRMVVSNVLLPVITELNFPMQIRTLR